MSVHPHILSQHRVPPSVANNARMAMFTTSFSCAVLAVIAYLAFLYQPALERVQVEPGQQRPVMVVPVEETKISDSQ